MILGRELSGSQAKSPAWLNQQSGVAQSESTTRLVEQEARILRARLRTRRRTRESVMRKTIRGLRLGDLSCRRLSEPSVRTPIQVADCPLCQRE